MNLFVSDARVVSGDGRPAQSGVNVRIRSGKIADIGADLVPEPGEPVLLAQSRVLMPAFVDAHTHALWAGDRWADFELSLQGKSYADIARGGGGIMSTVRAVRAATEEQLVENLRERLRVMLREGTTTLELKSGYGLDADTELKMLRAIDVAARAFPGTIVKTALLGHAIDASVPDFVERTIDATLSRVHEEFPGIAIDAFCEASAWSVADVRRLFERARELGHPLRLHVDQFTRLGGLALARELGLRSVDHLEASSEEELESLAGSETFGVMLPATAFHLNTPYPKAGSFLRAGGRLVLSSNCNPGSAPSSSLPFTIALAVRHCGVTVDEAIAAATSRAAELLGFSDRGRVEKGQRADLVLLRHRDERLLALEFGGNPADAVIVGGALVCSAGGD